VFCGVLRFSGIPRPGDASGKGKGKRSIAVRKKPHRYGNSRAIWVYSITCHPAEVIIPPSPQPKLVLDYATPGGCKT